MRRHAPAEDGDLLLVRPCESSRGGVGPGGVSSTGGVHPGVVWTRNSWPSIDYAAATLRAVSNSASGIGTGSRQVNATGRSPGDDVVSGTEERERLRPKLERLRSRTNSRTRVPCGSMVDVPLDGWLSRCLARLGLPVEQLAIDRVVAVHGRRRVVALGLVEVDEEHVAPRLWNPEDSALSHLRFHAFAESERRDYFLPGVARVERRGSRSVEPTAMRGVLDRWSMTSSSWRSSWRIASSRHRASKKGPRGLMPGARRTRAPRRAS